MTKSEHIPQIRIVKLDEKDAANQMIVTTVWALECSYEFFSYDGTSLQLLGKLESDYCLYEPELSGRAKLYCDSGKGSGPAGVSSDERERRNACSQWHNDSMS